MTDIVERLRGAAAGTHGLDEADEVSLLNEAANKIEELTNQRDELLDQVQEDAVLIASLMEVTNAD